MKVVTVWEYLKENPVYVLAAGIGLLLGILGIIVLLHSVVGYPVSIEAYQYQYPAGTNAITPLTNESLNVHASGVALSHTAYAVSYTEQSTIVSTPQNTTDINTSIEYEVNNLNGGSAYLEQTLFELETDNTFTPNTTHIYENNTTSFIHSPETNSTTWKPRGEGRPLVASNQLRLPRSMASEVSYISWTPVGPTTIQNTTYLQYTADHITNMSDLYDMQSVQTVNGTLSVNTHTNVITYTVTVTGTTDDGKTRVTHQELEYRNLSQSTQPTNPPWATKENSTEQPS